MQLLASINETSPVQHIIVSLIESGLSIFYENLYGDSIDPDLFSALFTAASLVRRVEGGSSSVYEIYHLENQMAHICYGTHLAGIAVSNGPIAETFMGQLKLFVDAYEVAHGILLTNWDGDRSFFDHEWASRLLREYIGTTRILYRLHDQAMERTTNARQIRLVLLIKRHMKSNTIELDSILRCIVDELIIPLETAKILLSELETSGAVLLI